MGKFFKTSTALLQRDEDRPFTDRTYKLLQLDGPRTKIETEDTTVDAILKRKENVEINRVPLRTQLIGDPTRPFGVGDQLLQFFVRESSRHSVRTHLTGGVIFETDGEQEVPLVHVSKDDVTRMISGEGFTVTVPSAASVAAAASTS